MTLDLRKCYNLIRWPFGYHALISLGIPLALVDQWLISVMRVTRTWCIHADLCHAGQATNGFAEGDTMSVLVMIALATVWVCTMESAEATIRDSESFESPASSLWISAYADNWSWMSHNPRTHGLYLEHTTMVTTPAGVQVDFSKTWCFATASGDLQIIQETLTAHNDEQPIAPVKGAKDLGLQMYYSGHLQLGAISDRIANGQARLNRLEGMPHSLDIKEHMVVSSVLPAVLHGAETRPLSDASLKSLRSQIAHALVGHAPNLTPSIVLLLGKNGILDPEFHMIKRTILAARLFLLEAAQEEATRFLHIASQFQGVLLDVKGPASALSFCLSLLGWQIDKHGVILPLNNFLSPNPALSV